MRPNDIYALPSLSEEPWHRGYGLVARFFDDDFLESEVNREAALEAGSDDLVFAQKLYHNGDGNRIAAYTACLWRGKPIGIVVQAGRGGDDVKVRIVTDLEGYRSAKAYLEAWKDPRNDAEGDAAASDAEIEVLSGVYGYRVMTGPDGAMRLTPETHVDRSGHLVFDEVAFRTAFDAIVRPAFGGPMGGMGKGGADKGSAFEQGIRSQRMRALAAEAVRQGVPEGLRTSTDFTIPEKDPKGHRRLDWIAALVATDEATYGIGLPNYGYATGFAWVPSLQGENLGGPELFDACARDASSVPTP